mgnify:CR=1 FL=1
MRKQALMIAGLGLLLMQGALWSQAVTVSQEMVVQIMNLKYYPVQEMSRILETICGGDGTQIVVDENTNCLIVRATPDRMAEISGLVAQLDRQTKSAPASEPLLCRVYMVEAPSGLKPFTVALEADSAVSFSSLRKAAGGRRSDFQIDTVRYLRRDPLGEEQMTGFDFAICDKTPNADAKRIEFFGRATSNEIIQQMFGLIPGAHVVDIQWENRVPDAMVSAAQVRQLPEQLRQHIRKFLGDNVQTVGYWFGNMSSPGEIKAPIGPWSILLEVKPTQTTALAIEVMVHEWQGENAMEILGNSMQGKVGKPIIIGYNRKVNEVRTMGAMIILLEADTTSGE